MEPRFWINLQSEYDMRMVARELQDTITPRIRFFNASPPHDFPRILSADSASGARLMCVSSY